MSSFNDKDTGIDVSIDTVEMSVVGANVELLDVTYSHLINADSEIIRRASNRKSIPGTHGNHCLQVRTIAEGNLLHISGSPYGFKHGQNVWTSNDMTGACVSVLRQLQTELGFKIQRAEGLRWQAGDIDLHRVDLAVNYNLGSAERVANVLKQVGRQFVEQPCSIRKSHSSIYWAPQNAKRYQVCFYAKGQEMRRKKNNSTFHHKLVDVCDPILRVEIRLRRAELVKLRLDKAAAWKDDTAGKIVKKYMARLPVLNVQSNLFNESEFDEVTDRMRPVLALHKLGVPLDFVYSERTLQRHRHYFRNKKIDIRCPSQENPILLIDVLKKERVMKTPQWMIDEGLAPSK